MHFLLSMPGGSEWLLIILFFGFVLLAPTLAIYYYLKSRRLEREVEELRRRGGY